MGVQGAISVSMISCKQCGTHNSLDSTFCRKCGNGFEEIEIQDGRAKLEALTVEGNLAFHEGRTDEALAVAENVLLSDPNAVSALWLKAICHERRDEIAHALECADRIVELNPDSDLDKIRRNQLRAKLASQLHVEKPDRRIALVGAVAACVLVLCVGALAANMARADRTPTDSSVAQNQPQNTLLNTPTNQTQTDEAQTPNQGSGQPNQNTGASPASGSGSLGVGDVPPIQSRPGSNYQPNIDPPKVESGTTLPQVQGGIGPVTIDPNVMIVPKENKPPQKGTSDDPKPDTTMSNEGVVADNAADQGEIDIRLSSGSGPKAGSDSNGVKSQSLTANNAFELGNYRQAASLFEQAIRNGGDPVSLNQRLGQTYERLGQLGEAKEAYRRAVQAGESALASGRGNPDRISSALDSCKAALRKLGG